MGADEDPLGDEKWDAIARNIADQMGFTEVSGKAPIRWVAIHHGVSTNGNDHVHSAATMVREDGNPIGMAGSTTTRPRAATRAIEAKYALATVAGREFGTAERGEKPAERANTQRVGESQTAPKDDARVVIKPRFAAGGTDVVTGYSVALKPAGLQREARLLRRRSARQGPSPGQHPTHVARAQCR